MIVTRLGRIHVLVALFLAIGLFGCHSEPEVLPITPDYPTLGKSRPTRRGIPSLVVSTQTWIDLNLASGDDGAVRRPTGYTLFDSQGVEIMYVRNSIGTLDSEPTTLDLDPGRYLIRPDKPGKRSPIFWIVVEPGKVTEVDIRK
jgi:hypothetical protein